jgi:hypothetical protein
VCDGLLLAAEPVGRAAAGVALVRPVRCLDGPLDVVHVTRLHDGSAAVQCNSLNRVAIGYVAQRKITVDGGEIAVEDLGATTRSPRRRQAWTALTIGWTGTCRRMSTTAGAR